MPYFAFCASPKGNTLPSAARTAAVIRSMATFVGASSARVTTTDRSRSVPLGHFSFRRFTAWTPSSESGNAVKSAWPMWSRTTGRAIATRIAAVASAAMTGRRITARTRTAQTPLPSGRSRPTIGRRSRLTRSPRIASVAGRNVSEPMTATRMTEIVPTAIDRKSGSSSRNRPPIEIITASPEKNTARPAVALDASIDAIRGDSLPRRRRSVRNRVTMNSE